MSLGAPSLMEGVMAELPVWHRSPYDHMLHLLEHK